MEQHLTCGVCHKWLLRCMQRAVVHASSIMVWLGSAMWGMLHLVQPCCTGLVVIPFVWSSESSTSLIGGNVDGWCLCRTVNGRWQLPPLHTTFSLRQRLPPCIWIWEEGHTIHGASQAGVQQQRQKFMFRREAARPALHQIACCSLNTTLA